MRRDIVKMLEGEKDVTNAIVLTHNIDFVFIQSVVLPALRKCGHPTLTIFADAQCAVESYQYQHMVLDSLGTRFRVVPVSMRPGFRFHPKAVLLSSQQKGVLMVGSGNLTFGGWRENAEAWCRFDTDVDGTAPFAAFLKYLESVVSLTPLRDSITAEINESFEPQLRPWARDMVAPFGLFGRPGNNASLIEQMQAALSGRPVNSLLVHSPYFDDNGKALQELGSRFSVRPKVAVQRKRSGLHSETALAISELISLSSVNFQHKTHDNKLREAFIHAKWYAFEHDDSVSVFLGSANCSQAALTIPGSAGNAELMVLINLSKEDFESQFIAELEFIDEEPLLVLADEPIEPDTNTHYKLYLSAARLDQGCLQIAYAASQGIRLEKLVADGDVLDFSEAEPGIIVAHGVSPYCRHIQLIGCIDAEHVQSNLLWVDHEQALSTTARSRSVVDAVRAKVQSQNWNIGAWSDIANVFFRNLQYMPARVATVRLLTNRSDGTLAGTQLYTAQDVFSESYGLPAFNRIMGDMGIGADDRVTSLRQLLLRWFGHKDEEVVEADQVAPPDNGDDDIVDLPEEFPTKKKTSPPIHRAVQEIRESDRRRALDMLEKVASEMSSERYLAERQLETISVDIQFASVLLRTALCESWITAEEFFNSTHKIWSSLFFTSKPNPCAGWLEHRLSISDSSEEFIARMSSTKLAAALAAWSFAVPEKISTPEHVRFALAQALSVARLPWLWTYQDGNEFAKELQDLLISSTKIDKASFWKHVDEKWVDLLRRGHALQQFESAIGQMTPGALKDRIAQQVVKKGELLWQGNAGICVAEEAFDRSVPGCKAHILYLQKAAGNGVIVASFAIPLKALITENIISLDNAPKQSLLSMIDSLAGAF